MDIYMENFQVVPVPAGDRMEHGGKIYLPASVLQALATKKVMYPLMFLIRTYGGGSTHCGMMEFNATEGELVMPRWMMKNLGLSMGDPVQLSTAALPKGGLVKLRPREMKFTELSNPKAVLEAAMKNFTCISTGDSFPVHYNGDTYTMDVEELMTLNNSPARAVCVIDTDLKVDFQRPADMPDSPVRATPSGGQGFNFGNMNFTPQTNFAPPSLTDTPNLAKKEEKKEESKPAWGGSSGRTLSGRPAAPIKDATAAPQEEAPKPAYTAGGARTLGSSTVPSRLLKPQSSTSSSTTTGGGEPAPESGPGYTVGPARTLGSSSSASKAITDGASSSTTAGGEATSGPNSGGSGGSGFSAFQGKGRSLK